MQKKSGWVGGGYKVCGCTGHDNPSPSRLIDLLFYVTFECLSSSRVPPVHDWTIADKA